MDMANGDTTFTGEMEILLDAPTATMFRAYRSGGGNYEYVMSATSNSAQFRGAHGGIQFRLNAFDASAHSGGWAWAEGMELVNHLGQGIGLDSNAGVLYSNVPVNILDTTASTSTTDGALVIGGGLGVAGDIHAGGLITFGNPASPFTLNRVNSAIMEFTSGDATDVEFRLTTSTGADTLALVCNATNSIADFQWQSDPSKSYMLIDDAAGQLTLSMPTRVTDTTQSLSASANITAAKVKFTGSTAAQTLTLPEGTEGRNIFVRNAASVSVTVSRAGTDTIEGLTAEVLFPGESRLYTFIGTDWTIF